MKKYHSNLFIWETNSSDLWTDNVHCSRRFFISIHSSLLLPLLILFCRIFLFENRDGP